MLVSDAIKAAGYEGKVKIAMDCAATEFYGEGEGLLWGHIRLPLPSLVCLWGFVTSSEVRKETETPDKRAVAGLLLLNRPVPFPTACRRGQQV